MATRSGKKAASKVKRTKAGTAKSKAPKAASQADLETVTIRSSEFIPAAPSAVYRAFVDARTFSAVTGASATFERREGGRFSAADGFITGRFVRLQNDRRIVQEWKTTEWPVDAPPSLLELRFVPRENGTEVRMVQSQVPAGHASRYKRGWSALCWTPMKKYFHESR